MHRVLCIGNVADRLPFLLQLVDRLQIRRVVTTGDLHPCSFTRLQGAMQHMLGQEHSVQAASWMDIE